jgi:hypothetical protein
MQSGDKSPGKQAAPAGAAAARRLPPAVKDSNSCRRDNGDDQDHAVGTVMKKDNNRVGIWVFIVRDARLLVFVEIFDGM